MIPMTADQIATLVKARDILGEKAIEGEEYSGLCEAVQNSLLMVLKHSHVDLEKVDVPPNPIFAQHDNVVTLQGDSPESREQEYINDGRIEGRVSST